MSEEKHKSRKWIWPIVALLVLYPLSIGPVMQLTAASMNPWVTVIKEAVYAPLFWLCEVVPGLGKLLEFYVYIWWRIFGYGP